MADVTPLLGNNIINMLMNEEILTYSNIQVSTETGIEMINIIYAVCVRHIEGVVDTDN
jgi:hypothetical protein